MRGDGLNMRSHRYLLTRKIGDPTFYNETLVGNDPYSNRKQINIKIDQNFKSHRISGRLDLSNGRQHRLPRRLAGRTGGTSYRRPQIIDAERHIDVEFDAAQRRPVRDQYQQGATDSTLDLTDEDIRDAGSAVPGAGRRQAGDGKPYPVIVRPTGRAGSVFRSGER